MVITSLAANYDICFSLGICNVCNPPFGKELACVAHHHKVIREENGAYVSVS